MSSVYPFAPAIASTPLDEIKAVGLGFKSMAFDPRIITAGTAPTAGTVYLTAVPLRAGQTVSKLGFFISTAAAGTAPTHIYLSLADAAGKILVAARDAAADANWQATGLKPFNLSGTYEVEVDALHFGVLLQVGSWGTTQAALSRGGGIAGDQVLAATGGTSQTALPAVGSSLALAAQSLEYWMAAG